ncbi:MAG: aminotransferase class I/II-fold pyridoxal phosphate-dependent enzyme [Acidimicrobiia bacterium]|nr:aminotransferase class I/II-fold pyridoxal phosphate-dependent enzyme [Acidimicrobiia bacterium]
MLSSELSGLKMPARAPSAFEVPPYPYDRLDSLRQVANAFEGGCVNLSVGSPSDPPSAAVVAALSSSGAERLYPASAGSPAYRAAAAQWLARRFGVNVTGLALAGCVGTKEFVASVPRYLRLRQPERDTVLYPTISYPTYAMGAALAQCRAVPVPLDEHWHLDLSQISVEDATRALCLWVNTPANPTGALEDLAAVIAWGRTYEVPVLSDECYIEFTWGINRPRSILSSNVEGPASSHTASLNTDDVTGILAVHSLSKRSNIAGLRVGFYAGDPELVAFLSEVRKHAGLMIPGPVQQAAVVAFGDDAHVEAQRAIYRSRLARLAKLFRAFDPNVKLPDGGFYLWLTASDGDGWGLASHLASKFGALISPGEFYGPQGAGYVRVAAVASDTQISLLEKRMAQLAGSTVHI